MNYALIKKRVKRWTWARMTVRALKHPVNEIREWVSYFCFKEKHKNIFHFSPNMQQGHKILVVSLLGDLVSAFKQEGILAKALQIHNAEPIIVTKRGAWINRYYKLFGIKKFVYLDDFLNQVDKEPQTYDIDGAMAKLNSSEELLDYQYQGVTVGKFVVSTLIRQTRTGCLDLNDHRIRLKIRKALGDSVRYVHAARKILDQYQPDVLLFLEKGYSPYGEFFGIALERKLNIVQWCGSHRESALTLKRYTQSNQDRHPASLSMETWEQLKSVDPENVRKIIEQELYENYSQGKWFSEVGTQFYSRLTNKQRIIDELQLESQKKTAVIFSHLFWDATFFWGTDLFSSYREWFVETVKAACENKNVNWIIKMHPSNIVKMHRDRYEGELAEKMAIREEIKEIPSHIRILEPATGISTYSLYAIMDYCLTVRGTVGIEAAFFGVPVLTAGTGRYDRLGFTIDSSSRDEYLDKVRSIHLLPPVSKEQHDKAIRFAYGTFILRPYRLESMEFRYRNDAVASSEVNYRLKTREELLRAKDLEKFSAWALNSSDEDYLESKVAVELHKRGIT